MDLPSTTQSALVLFSGGQDSTVCLAWALERFDHVETIGFDYRQRHKVELTCRAEIRAALNASFQHGQRSSVMTIFWISALSMKLAIPHLPVKQRLL
jgi:7-cyano-7-deazaguanine synthase in queuosine biosynthesis